MKHMHSWKTISGSVNGFQRQECRKCGLMRETPTSRVRRGFMKDWDYWINGEWERLHIVPQCEHKQEVA